MAAYTFSAKPPFAIEAMTPAFTLGGHATPYPIGLLAMESDGAACCDPACVHALM